MTDPAPTQMTDPAQFVNWIDELKRTRFKTWRAFAAAVDMTESGFLRGVRSGTLSVVNLVRLAEVTEEDPLTVLRMAGKDSEAAILERLFGTGAQTLKPSQRKLLELWETLEAADQVYVRGLMEHFVKTRARTDGLPTREPALHPRARAAVVGRRRRR